MELPRAVVGLPRLLRRHVGGRFRRRGLLGRLLLGIGRRRRRRRNRRRAGLRRLCRSLRRRSHDRRLLFADGLTVVVADHHDDEFRLLGSDDLARHLRPLDVAARVVANEPGIGAMLAHDADLGLLRKGVFEPVGEPVGVGVAHDHDRGRGLGLLLRGSGRARIIDRRLAFRSRWS
jgi:hypothetical protein